MEKDFEIVAASEDFRAHGKDFKKGQLFRVEDDYVMIEGKFFCQVGSPNYYSYFEEV